MEHIPILRFGEILLVTIQEEMHDRLGTALRDALAERIVASPTSGILIDLSAVGVVDAFFVRVLHAIAAISQILGAETVLVGIQPSVAMTLALTETSLGEARMAMNVEKGMALLRDSVAKDASGAPPEM